jgi:hypothetical protein
MDPDVQRMAQVLVMVSAFVTFVVTISLASWFAVRKFGGPTPRNRDSDPPIDDSRFARLEDAVDSIAIEVERIAEAQRFTAKLMSERLPNRLPESTPDSVKQL